MTSDLDTGGESSIELRRVRIFRMRLWIGVGCYLLASVALDVLGHASSPWRLVLAVLALLFMVWNVVVIVLRVRQLDEYQRKLFFPGLAVGFAVAIFAAITLGTLNAAGFAIPDSGWPIALIGVLAWQFTNIVTGAPTA
ncbi:hypothetical protein [Diaminobutyricibacter sp. McL0608]|uniref:hypothetical protein n=1 Tax=Leifsonia sp. McL0608 TaxID=3143537 RepID=UPI0031F3099E